MTSIAVRKETKVEVQRDGAWMEAVVVEAQRDGRGRRYKQPNNIIYEGKYPRAANSGVTSIASSPGDLQTNAQSQRHFEEVKNHRRHSDRTKNRATLDVEECSIQAIRNRDSRNPKTFNHGNAILKNVVAVSQKESNNVEQNQRRNSLAHHSKGVKRVYVHDLRKDQTYGSIQDTPGDTFKRFKHTEPTKAMDLTQTNNPLNVVAEERLETHDRELLAYDFVLEAFYAQCQSHLTWERHNLLSSLRLALHITIDEHIDKLKRLISQS